VRFDAMIVAADLAAVALALPCAYFVRFHAPFPLAPRGDWQPADYWRIYPAAILAWMISLAAVHAYRFGHEIMSMRVLQRLVKGSLLAVAIIITANFFVRIAPETAYARILAPLAFVLAVGFLSAGRFVLRKIVRRLQEKEGIGLKRLLIFGTTELARQVTQRVREQAHPTYCLAGFLSADPSLVGQPLDGMDVLGETSQLLQLLAPHKIDDVILAEPTLSPEEILGLMLDCEKEMVGCRTVPNLVQTSLTEVQSELFEGVPLYGLKETPLQGLNAVLKRAFDFVVAMAGLAATMPFYPLIWLAIRLDSPGPLFYKQKRMGLDGTRFNLYKFRSMVADAEEQTGPVWATRDDPRRTRVGRVLRRWNLDELPQLINVLRADMSLVGPRPERPFFVKQFKEQLPRYMARHTVRSGLTGWAQVHGLRGQSPIGDRLAYDLYYIENWSFWLDLKILAMTLRAWRRGAN
jgi:exopolysaccharide biosynthesis polyprenyl glycosylphosphotransferase